MTVVTIVGILLTVVARVIAIRVTRKVWPAHVHAVVGWTLVARETVFALVFGWLAYSTFEHDGLHIAAATLFAFFAAFEALKACGFAYVLLTDSLAPDATE